jgi:hypothetical protein
MDAMTSAQIRITGTLCVALMVAACSQPPPRETLVAPYYPTQVWAVAPPMNESGVSIVDTGAVADMIAQELQSVEGIDVLPVNRVLAAMRHLQMESVATAEDARVLLNLLDVDAVLIGSVTAWDPYPPLRLGLATQVHGLKRARSETTDPTALVRTTAGEPAGPASDVRPLATAAAIFDARDQATLSQLELYAASRHEPDSAYGPEVYLVSLDLFTQFATHRLLHDLLWQERMRAASTTANKEHERP